jgi:hypothetical protein
MQILHITPKSNGYEIVNLIANRIDRHNSFCVYEKDGKRYMSGGFIINDTPEIRKVLDNIPKEEQYNFVKEFKMDPFKRPYLNEPFGKDEL